MKIIHILPAFILTCLVFTPVTGQAEDSVGIEKASGEDLSVAMGHYSRSRALLISAIEEFDRGAKLANPKIILDGKRWRSSLVERAQELERLLDPQPRVTKR